MVNDSSWRFLFFNRHLDRLLTEGMREVSRDRPADNISRVDVDYGREVHELLP